jgi:hypothetical protein
MSPLTHKIYIWTLSGIVLAAVIFLSWTGFSYYSTPLEERFYHPAHESLKPSGLFGHGLGIFGTLLILIGVFGYMARKRFRSLARWGVLKYWLEFHIFLCTLGPVMVLFHTAFKFGGIVSIAFWSMVAVMLSGVIGRFIYNQIPRTIQGRELSLSEIRQMKDSLQQELEQIWPDGVPEYVKSWFQSPDQRKSHTPGLKGFFSQYLSEFSIVRDLGKKLRAERLPDVKIRQVLSLVKREQAVGRKIENLQLMQQLFRYWHVAHLPFAVIMLIIMVIHVAITLAFGYTWAF